jgi:hypothetical protein
MGCILLAETCRSFGCGSMLGLSFFFSQTTSFLFSAGNWWLIMLWVPPYSIFKVHVRLSHPWRAVWFTASFLCSFTSFAFWKISVSSCFTSSGANFAASRNSLVCSYSQLYASRRFHNLPDSDAFSCLNLLMVFREVYGTGTDTKPTLTK